MIRQTGIISIAIVLYMFENKEANNATAEIYRAHTSWLLCAAVISLFPKRYKGIRQGREKDEVGDQKH